MPPRPQPRRIKPANDLRPPRTLVITLPRAPHWKKSLAGSVVLLSLALITTSMVIAMRPPRSPTSQTVTPTTASATAQVPPPSEPKLHDIILPAEQLSPGAMLADETSLAKSLEDLPALDGTVRDNKPLSNRTLLFHAAAALRQQNYADAIDSYTQALAFNSHDTLALTGLVYAEAMLGDYTAAIRASRRLTNLHPHDGAAQADLARLLLQNNQPRAALAAMDKAARLSPSNLNYRFELATLYDRNGMKEQATQLYQQLLDIAQHDQTLAATWPLTAITQRLSYLETSSSAVDSTADETDAPSTTSPVASR